MSENTTVLGEYSFVPVKTGKDISFVKRLSRKSICPLRKTLTLPEGIEQIDSNAWINKKNPYSIYIPSTVKKIGYNNAKFFVSKKNKCYSSNRKCLYSKDFKVFLKGFLKRIKIKKGTEKVILDNSSFKKIYLAETVNELLNIEKYKRNSYFKVLKNNASFASWKGSLYSKDYKTLYYLYVKKNGDVYIHPDCEAFEEGAFEKHRVHGIKPGKFYVPEKYQSKEEIENFKKMIFYSKNSYSCAGVNVKEYSIDSVKEIIGNSGLVRGNFYPLDKEMIFPKNLVYIDKYYNPGQGEYIPIFCNESNAILSKDHNPAEWNSFQIDNLILPVIKLLNDNGFETTACCSGHLLSATYYHINAEDKTRVVARILERSPFDSKTRGYIAFAMNYKEIKKLFISERKYIHNRKIRKFFHIKEKSDMEFYIEDNKEFQSNEKIIILRFEYKPNEKTQRKVMNYLEEKFKLMIENKKI